MAWLPSFLQSRAHAAVNEGFDWLRTWWTQTWRFTKRKERSDKETNGGEKKEPRTILSRTANESRNINQELQAGRRMAFLGCFHQNWWFNPPFFKETLEKLLNLLLILRKLYLFLQFPFNTFNLTFDYNLHPKAWVKIDPILWYLNEGKSD